MQKVWCLGTFFAFSLKRSTLVFIPGAATRTSTVWPERKLSRFLSAFALTRLSVLDRPRLTDLVLNGHLLPEHATVTLAPAGSRRANSWVIFRRVLRTDQL